MYRSNVSGRLTPIGSVPPEFPSTIGIAYQPVRLAFEGMSRTQKTRMMLTKLWNAEISALRTEEQRNKTYPAVQPKGTVLATQGCVSRAAASKGKGQQGGNQRDMTNLKCYNCQRMGHFSSDCPVMKKENSEQTNGQRNRRKGSKDPEGHATVSKALAFMTAEDSPKAPLILDSSGTHHLTNVKGSLVNARVLEVPLTFDLASNSTIQALEVGNVRIKIGGHNVTVQDVYLVPESRVGLLSVQRMMEKGWQVAMTRTGGWWKKNKVRLTSEKKGGLWTILAEQKSTVAAYTMLLIRS